MKIHDFAGNTYRLCFGRVHVARTDGSEWITTQTLENVILRIGMSSSLFRVLRFPPFG
jgi:hypothetical protein